MTLFSICDSGTLELEVAVYHMHVNIKGQSFSRRAGIGLQGCWEEQTSRVDRRVLLLCDDFIEAVEALDGTPFGDIALFWPWGG